MCRPIRANNNTFWLRSIHPQEQRTTQSTECTPLTVEGQKHQPMADLLYTQDYPTDTTHYDYAYVSVRNHSDGSSPSFVPWRKLVFQVVHEANEESLFESKEFEEWATAKRRSALRAAERYLARNGWERDGGVYNRLLQEGMPRYRRLKR